jgi:hypothetical protein
MKRKFLFFGLISISIIAIGFLLFLVINSKNIITSDALRAIPIDAAIVVKTNNLNQLSQQLYKNNKFWGAIKEFELVTKANKFFDYSESLRTRSSVFDQLVFNNQIFLSVHTVGKGTPALFFAANVPERLKSSDIQTLIAKESAEKYTLTEKEYNGAKILTYTLKDSELVQSFSVTIHQGIAMYSQSLLLVESAIGQLSSGVSLVENNYFIEALKTAGTNEVANIFVNHSQLPSIFFQQVHTGLRSGLKSLSNLATWSELDLSIKDDAFYLNGFAQVSDSLNNFYRVFAKQKPVKMKIPEILPAQTAALVFLGISDIETYFTSYRKYLEARGMLLKYIQHLDSQGKSIGKDITKFYSSIFGNELALAFIPFEGEDYNNSWFVVAEANSQSLARQELMELIGTYATKNGQSRASFERSFAVDREKSVKIYRFPNSGLHESLFGSLFSVANDQYFTFIDSYIVFGSSVESLSRLILANIHNKQLAVEQSFVEFSQSLSIESNFTAYINPGKAEMIYGHKLNPSYGARLLSRIETVNKIQGIAIQLTGGKNMIFNNICARYTPFSVDAPQTVWETRLDTIFSMKPQLVINHTNQDREIFVQDIKNNIYLINHVGRVLWKRPLAETIIGEVDQVDLFRNGKLQLVFNTKSFLYIVDRNGNNVDGFPVKLRSPATNSVAVFDYDNNRNYRFFIAGEDRHIYVYNRSGNVVTGWDFDRTEKHVNQQIRHEREGNRDYIVLADENRPYIIDRRGDERVKPNIYFPKAPNSNIVLEDKTRNSAARFVTTDIEGKVRFIYLDGKVEEKEVKKLSSGHFFDYQDVDADGVKDFIFLDEKELSVYKNNGKELFSRKFTDEMIPQVIYFHFGGRDRKLGVTCSETSQIYLINGDGSLYKGFPLKGITPFSIGRFASTKSTFNLLVGSSAGYVLNYAVQ